MAATEPRYLCNVSSEVLFGSLHSWFCLFGKWYRAANAFANTQIRQFSLVCVHSTVRYLSSLSFLQTNQGGSISVNTCLQACSSRLLDCRFISSSASCSQSKQPYQTQSVLSCLPGRQKSDMLLNIAIWYFRRRSAKNPCYLMSKPMQNPHVLDIHVTHAILTTT